MEFIATFLATILANYTHAVSIPSREWSLLRLTAAKIQEALDEVSIPSREWSLLRLDSFFVFLYSVGVSIPSREWSLLRLPSTHKLKLVKNYEFQSLVGSGVYCDPSR